MRKIIYGPPGTGKTYYLMNELEKVLQKVEPSKIGYFTFSRNAAQEGKSRAMDKFNLTEKDLPYFRTLHSFCFNILGLKKENVMQEKDYRDLGRDLQIEFEGIRYDHDHEGVLHSKDPYISLISLARNKRMSPIDLYNQNGNSYNLTYDKLDIINKELYRYKKQKGLIDYIDMLEKFLDKGDVTNKLDVIFVDEAQDLSKIQWAMIEKIEKDNGCDVWIAGDDDQAIFGWAGADVDSFIDWDALEMPLKQSERVPSQIQQKALSIISRVKDNRLEKDYLPRQLSGQVLDVYDFKEINMNEGDWLILARTNPLLKQVPLILKNKGFFFETKDGQSISKKFYDDILNWDKFRKGEEIAEVQLHRLLEKIKGKPNKSLKWYDAFTNVSQEKIDYVFKMIINGEDLSKSPRIKISTIHSAKGGEATNVVLFLNQTINTMRAANKSVWKQDEEYRVWYVGVTRAIQDLYLVKCKNKQKEFII